MSDPPSPPATRVAVAVALAATEAAAADADAEAMPRAVATPTSTLTPAPTPETIGLPPPPGLPIWSRIPSAPAAPGDLGDDSPVVTTPHAASVVVDRVTRSPAPGGRAAATDAVGRLASAMAAQQRAHDAHPQHDGVPPPAAAVERDAHWQRPAPVVVFACPNGADPPQTGGSAAAASPSPQTPSVTPGLTPAVARADGSLRGITMHLLTYNLFLRPPLIRSGPSDYKEARLEQFACEVLPHYDVVAFQELFAFANGRRDTLLRRARAAGLPHHAVCPVPGLWEGRIDAGLAIVSRFPIVKTALLTYDRGIHSDWLAAKGVLYAKLAVLPNRHVHVFTSHTQASYEMAPGEDSPSRQIRERQLARAARFMVRTLLKTRDRLDDPVLFCGDLNVNARPMAATPPTAEPPSPTPSPRSDAAGAVSLAAAESPKPLTTPVFHPTDEELTRLCSAEYCRMLALLEGRADPTLSIGAHAGDPHASSDEGPEKPAMADAERAAATTATEHSAEVSDPPGMNTADTLANLLSVPEHARSSVSGMMRTPPMLASHLQLVPADVETLSPPTSMADTAREEGDTTGPPLSLSSRGLGPLSAAGQASTLAPLERMTTASGTDAEASPARRRPFAVFHDLLPRVKGYPPPPTTTNVLPGRTDDGKCLDYIFLVETPVGAAAANPIASGTIKIRDVAVRPFPVSNQPYEHLSDHCGVTLEMHLCSD